MTSLPKPAAGGGAKRPRPSRFLLVCLVGGMLILVLVCWFWFTQGPELANLRGHRGMVRSLSFSPDGAMLASGGDDHQIRVWDAASYRFRLILDGHTDTPNSVPLPPDTALLPPPGATRTARQWHPTASRNVAAPRP